MSYCSKCDNTGWVLAHPGFASKAQNDSERAALRNSVFACDACNGQFRKEHRPIVQASQEDVRANIARLRGMLSQIGKARADGAKHVHDDWRECDLCRSDFQHELPREQRHRSA